MLQRALKRRRATPEPALEGAPERVVRREGGHVLQGPSTPMAKLAGPRSASLTCRSDGVVGLGEGAVLTLEPSKFRVDKLALDGVSESRKDFEGIVDDNLSQAIEVLSLPCLQFLCMVLNCGVTNLTLICRCFGRRCF